MSTHTPPLTKRLLIAASAICLSASLAACAPRTRETAPPATRPAEPQPETPIPKPTLPKPKPPAPKPRPSDKPPIATPETPETPEALPTNFIGLSKSDIVALFGPAQEESPRQPGEAWTYRLGSCVAEFVFLLDVTNNDRFVADWKVTGDTSTPSQERCLQRLRARHGK